MTVPRALISVSDKRGVVEFARKLTELGWEVVSTGGTAAVLSQGGVAVLPIEKVTGFPEMLDGRVKTLHPAVHGALLARRDLPAHMEALAQHGLTPIDLVAVNLYPFRETVAKPDVKLEDAVEQIDIGGPSMLRSAAKNHGHVLPVVDPRDYDRVIEILTSGQVEDGFRRELAAKVFSHTAGYDAAIAAYLSHEADLFPPVVSLVLERVQDLRYGENPQQRAALYSTREGRGVDVMNQLHGKELSFNNLLDIEAASLSVAPWPDRPACAVIKHTTPCGIALGKTTEAAYERALATDPKSAFGSVVGFNTVVGPETAEAMSSLFVEAVVAPRFQDEAVAVFQRKKNLRVVELPLADKRLAFDYKRVRGGFLVQERFVHSVDESRWKIATERQPTAEELRDLRFGWAAVASVKSNAILLAKDEAAIGIGAGQMSRVDASFLAAHKARDAGHDPTGAVLASDAFFPFADGVEQAAAAGVTAIIQPGGSVRDEEVITAANACGMAMVLTGQRQFRH
ncbi:MAG: bifunctional phosphoribosylaminoimidazolecarboxamide formyltransferase/IMP cyclohydrolase [Gemmatimonadota bacterium]|nr:MAG: bifunctional phosphoribosylaminoimidazolecarboxamide formyltransferase/IMP cyclohydrolase [Gemmatimonadota bacterium]